jgi:hypothetical protein
MDSKMRVGGLVTAFEEDFVSSYVRLGNGGMCNIDGNLRESERETRDTDKLLR